MVKDGAEQLHQQQPHFFTRFCWVVGCLLQRAAAAGTEAMLHWSNAQALNSSGAQDFRQVHDSAVLWHGTIWPLVEDTWQGRLRGCILGLDEWPEYRPTNIDQTKRKLIQVLAYAKKCPVTSSMWSRSSSTGIAYGSIVSVASGPDCSVSLQIVTASSLQASAWSSKRRRRPLPSFVLKDSATVESNNVLSPLQ